MSKKKDGKGHLDRLRNIGIIAHIDAGKTTLSERILFYSGRIHRMGEVHEGTATMDFMPEEQERGITITSALTTCQWGANTINIIDTPGHVDFTIEVQRSLRVLDGAVGVFCAVGGVEPQSETVWRQSENYHVPKLAFVNKMDRLGANFQDVLTSMKDKLGARPLAIQVPDGEGQEFSAVFDLVGMRRLVFDPASQGMDYEARELSPAEAERLAPWRDRMLETLAEEDEPLCDLYLAGTDIEPDTVRQAIRRATIGLKLVPTLAGSALKNVGVQPLIDAICLYLPSPADVPQVEGVDPASGEKKSFPAQKDAPLSALAFKLTTETGRRLVLMRLYSGVLAAGSTVFNSTQGQEERVARLFRLHADRKEPLESAQAGDIVAAAGMRLARTGDTLCLASDPIILEQIEGYKPVISLAIEPRNAEEADRVNEILDKYMLEDPTLRKEIDQDSGQIILSGMGELHLEVVLERLAREHSLSPRAGKPQVVYQETAGRTAEGAEEFSRELGEDMHYGYVRVAVEPLARDQGRVIRFEVDPALWPSAWLDAAHEGLTDSLQSGVLKGYPVQDVLVRVLELKRRDSQSSAVGYRMAAAQALKKALAAADPLLLEPIMRVEIPVPGEFVGDVVGLLGAKGAKVDNMIDRGAQKIVQALAPLSRMFGFSTDLRSATQGRAGFSMHFERFDVLH